MENPSFFAVLPAAVRYDARLSASEKIFFAEITALTEAEGYCYAANAYFSDLYGVDERTVRRWLGHLQTAGYIEVEPAAGGEAPHPRRIWLAGRTVRGADVDAAAEEADKNVRGADKMSGGRTKMSGRGGQKCPGLPLENKKIITIRARACARMGRNRPPRPRRRRRRPSTT